MQSEQQSPAIDVWSAGVILLYLLTKRYPIFESPTTSTRYRRSAFCWGRRTTLVLWDIPGYPSILYPGIS